MKQFLHYDFVYQLRIELKDSKPKIWRRIQVPVQFTFGQLHDVIQVAFGWENQHLHRFNVLVLADTGMNLVQFELRMEGMEPMAVESLDENIEILQKHLNVATHFEYHYDFGDDWIHEIFVEGLLVQTKKQKYPYCLEGENNHAFEDIGGVYGYQHALAVLADPQHEEHKELKAWLKECYGAAKVNKFDPYFFDPKKLKFNK